MIKLVTTCNAAGLNSYGRKMLATFTAFWPKSVELLLYAEDFELETRFENVTCRALPAWFTGWKAKHARNLDAHGRDETRNRDGRAYDFKRDCVRFSHKVAALTDAADECDLLIWADADTLTHAPVTEDWIEGLFAEPGYMALLDRERTYPECGFMMFRPEHPRHDDFMRLLRGTYESGAVFKMKETHDSFVIEQLVKRCVGEGWFPAPYSLSGKARIHHHVFPHSPLGERLDHAKGARKAHGRTPKTQVAGRKEAHWK